LQKYYLADEKDIALREAPISITRVADKVLGVNDGTALALPDAT
jgi:hypothetical protein